MSESPNIVEAFRTAMERSLFRMMGPMPGKVLEYNATNQTAVVQPLVKRLKVTEDGDVFEAIPPVQHVPILFPGIGVHRLTFPVVVGDKVLLIPAGCSLDRWMASGELVDPADSRHHEMTDSVAIPGMFDLAHIPTTAPVDATVLHGPLIRLSTPTAADPVVRKSDLDLVVAKLNAFIGSYNTHVHVETGVTTNATLSVQTTMTAPAGSSAVKVP